VYVFFLRLIYDGFMRRREHSQRLIYSYIYDSLDTTLTEFSYISSQAQKWKDISAAWIRQLRS